MIETGYRKIILADLSGGMGGTFEAFLKTRESFKVSLCYLSNPDLQTLDFHVKNNCFSSVVFFYLSGDIHSQADEISLITVFYLKNPRTRGIVMLGDTDCLTRVLYLSYPYTLIHKRDRLCEVERLIALGMKKDRQLSHWCQQFLITGKAMQWIDKLNLLTRREKAVMRDLVIGMSPVTISQKMRLSIKTVSNHKRKAYLKLGISRTIHLLNFSAGCFATMRY
ncbi:regulatory protein LuxR [Serratia sp. AS12]|uniref:helix-turn-helix transcriptional regulator n=1 Tax=Serratia TaxID=613 RepID=UPI00020E9FEE|nr:MULTISPECIES: LuxR family transcriptional regulator [Serratia]AEF46375.1 regulatory protein LuxR [Serratia plymuthica AS9]AEF51327.1 regulatory protein LuxR [Serratia sp. AS12]AEG29035.1 regulatory protein LuxR [Serratia sp. AS13]UTN95096.1 LuxR C-terminal-related transcriptional regulator [Serratia plymuthica]